MGRGEAFLCYSEGSETVKEMHGQEEWKALCQDLESTTDSLGLIEKSLKSAIENRA